MIVFLKICTNTRIRGERVQILIFKSYFTRNVAPAIPTAASGAPCLRPPELLYSPQALVCRTCSNAITPRDPRLREGVRLELQIQRPPRSCPKGQKALRPAL